MSRKYNRYMRFISVLLIVLVAFKTVDFTLSEITDIWAYEDVGQSSGTGWTVVYEKLENGDTLTEKDYDLIFSQTGLGKPAVDVLTDNPEKIDEYREYYLADKDYSCVREGVCSLHFQLCFLPFYFNSPYNIVFFVFFSFYNTLRGL